MSPSEILCHFYDRLCRMSISSRSATAIALLRQAADQLEREEITVISLVDQAQQVPTSSSDPYFQPLCRTRLELVLEQVISSGPRTQ